MTTRNAGAATHAGCHPRPTITIERRGAATWRGKRKLRHAILVLLGAAAPAGAVSAAQPAHSEASGQLEEIVVTGQRASLESAVARQREAESLISALSADDVGNFPDQNVAEATRRLPGVSVENDQGEGRFIVLRGLDPNLNSTTINGLNVPSPQREGGRQVALDTIPSELLAGVVVAKSFTPDMNGDAIGGAVEIETLSAFDRAASWLTARVEGSYNTLQETESPRASLAAANTFAVGESGRRFGIAAAVSWSDRRFGSENNEVDVGWRTSPAGILYPVEPESRDYVINRERLGAALNLDFEATDTMRLFLRTLYTDYSDLEYRNRNEFLVRAAAPVSGTATSAQFNDRIRIDRDSKDRTQEQSILSLQAGADIELESWTIDVVTGYSRATEDEVNRIDATFRREFRAATTPGFLFDMNYSDPLRIQAAGANDATRAAVADPANYPLTEIALTDNTFDDEEWSTRVDFTRRVDWGAGPGFVKFGAQGRLREKVNSQDVRTLTAFGVNSAGRAFTAADFLGRVQHSLADFGPAIDPRAVRAFTNSRRGQFALEAFDSFAGDYTAEEDVYAGYAMAQLKTGRTTLTGGVRLEHTSFNSGAFRVEAGAPVPIEDGTSYTQALPSLNLVFVPNDRWSLRAAASRSIARPIPESAVARFAVDDDAAIIGNPDLKPFKAWNLDLTAEYYPAASNVISLGIFGKRIDDYIVTRDLAGQPGFEAYSSALRAENGDTADLFGVEINVQQTLDFLPVPFDGLLLSANYTYVDGQVRIDDGRQIALPKQSQNLANVALGYEKAGWSARVAFAYRGEYLDIINFLGVSDRFIASHSQWDASVKYDFSSTLQAYIEASNLNNEPMVATFADRSLLSAYEEYETTIALGMRVTF
jgi:TonB-dependent receptor